MPESSPAAFVVAGDIGGTHARFRLACSLAGELVPVAEHVFPVVDFASVDDALQAFVTRVAPSLTAAPIEGVCLAVAGPIAGGRAKLTNATWIIDADAIAHRFGIRRVALVNDFHAAATGIRDLRPQDVHVLQDVPAQPDAPRLVIGAGTGLGVAYAIPGGGDFHIIAGEGGHIGYAPVDDEQIELLRYLRPALGRVTAEHLVSGPGIVRLYAFARERAGVQGGALPDDVAREGSAAITRRAADGEIAATRALELFTAILGAVAGDHALSVLALGGVYIAGGIAPRLASHLQSGTFLASFRAKGVHAPLMQRMPVWLVLDERLGLVGATRLAFEHAHGRRNRADARS